MKNPVNLIIIISCLVSCSNRDINEGEAFMPRPVKDRFDDSHFTKITVDGVEYILMERDNNNPHEGFGFMAFRANNLMEKQDSIISYLRTLQTYQNKIYARMFNLSEEEAQNQFHNTLKNFLLLEKQELEGLEKEELTGSTESDND
ncbi:MAG: hypothetical protein AAF600_21410 [Bacteroidota bacterium]